MIPDAALQAWTPSAPSEARALVQAVQAAALRHGVNLPAPPSEPTNCCDSDCVGCVWEGFYGEVSFWRDDAVQQWAD